MKRLLNFFILFIVSTSVLAQNYYINPQTGKNTNNGKSPETSFKALTQINEIKLKAGDQLLLAAGMNHWGELKLHNLNGTDNNPIVISSYKDNDKIETNYATVNAKGFYNFVVD